MIQDRPLNWGRGVFDVPIVRDVAIGLQPLGDNPLMQEVPFAYFIY